VTQVAFGSDSMVLACTGSVGGMPLIELWDPPIGKFLNSLVRELSQDDDRWGEMIWEMAYSADGRWLAIYDEFDMLDLWDAKAGRLVRSWNIDGGHGGLAFSPDSQLLACGLRDGVAVWRLDEAGDPDTQS
jgi:WD40 repeat protein